MTEQKLYMLADIIILLYWQEMNKLLIIWPIKKIDGNIIQRKKHVIFFEGCNHFWTLILLKSVRNFIALHHNAKIGIGSSFCTWRKCICIYLFIALASKCVFRKEWMWKISNGLGCVPFESTSSLYIIRTREIKYYIYLNIYI